MYKGFEQVVSRSDERLQHFSCYTLQIIKAMPSKFLFSVRWQKHIYITLVLGEMLLLIIIIIIIIIITIIIIIIIIIVNG